MLLLLFSTKCALLSTMQTIQYLILLALPYFISTMGMRVTRGHPNSSPPRSRSYSLIIGCYLQQILYVLTDWYWFIPSHLYF